MSVTLLRTSTALAPIFIDLALSDYMSVKLTLLTTAHVKY
jgi:hypothetical protein